MSRWVVISLITIFILISGWGSYWAMFGKSIYFQFTALMLMLHALLFLLAIYGYSMND